jgi:hypothetical protein
MLVKLNRKRKAAMPPSINAYPMAKGTRERRALWGLRKSTLMTIAEHLYESSAEKFKYLSDIFYF